MSRRYLDQFNGFNPGPHQPAFVAALRKRAIERFLELGFPTKKNEDWHFTSAAPIAEREFTFVPARTGDVSRDDLAAFGFGNGEWHTAVFVNGRFAPELSDLDRLDPRVKVLSLSSAWADAPALAALVGTIISEPEQHAFTMLNTAFMPDGAVVHVPRDVVHVRRQDVAQATETADQYQRPFIEEVE